MANSAETLVKVVRTVGPRVIAAWPVVFAAIQQVKGFLDQHPGLPDQTRETLVKLVRQVLTNLTRRGAVAKIRGSLETVRSVAAKAKESGQPIDADAFTRRADAIGLGLELAEGQQGSVRKAALAGLRQQTDTLLAELIAAVTGTAQPT